MPANLADLPFADSDIKASAILADAVAPDQLRYEPLAAVDVYIAMSAAQKAIRLGNAEVANRACATLIKLGCASTAWKRLRTIAVEDIGIGDPPVAAFVLWLASRSDLHREFDHEALTRLAVRYLCSAVKSRDMCDIAFWSTLPGAVDHLVPALAQARTAELVRIAADQGQAFAVRHAAARCLFPARFKEVRPWKRRRREDRLQLYEALNMPPTLSYAIEADLSFGGDVLTSAGPVAWALLRSSKVIGVAPDPFDTSSADLIGEVPASAFDRHTRVGHRVLTRMLREHQRWKRFFELHPTAQPMACLLRALFYVEGGVLRPRLAYDQAAELYWSVLQAKFVSTGIRSLEDGGMELLSLVKDAVPIINDLRGEALRA